MAENNTNYARVIATGEKVASWQPWGTAMMTTGQTDRQRDSYLCINSSAAAATAAPSAALAATSASAAFGYA